ncbi:hypothetical protein DRQ25_11080 [Candidatus Fermentibacteria bacterium]|nr:MAG: hypothetical protein DRQ25_11080 [Candidatus Fermentibacteria bacterium]
MEQQTFTTKEVAAVAEFVQLVYNKAQFSNMSAKECLAIPRHFQFMNEHIKKMDENIMELVKVSKAKEKPALAKKKTTKKKKR